MGDCLSISFYVINASSQKMFSIYAVFNIRNFIQKIFFSDKNSQCRSPTSPRSRGSIRIVERLYLYQFEKRMRQIDTVETCHGTSLHLECVANTFLISIESVNSYELSIIKVYGRGLLTTTNAYHRLV
jgi:hypothetical protein